MGAARAPLEEALRRADGAFHGDTLGATALSGVEIFRRPFAGVLMDCARAPFPDHAGHARAFEAIGALVAREADTIAGVVVEPIVKGASGIATTPPRTCASCAPSAIATTSCSCSTRVFTGYGRTGPMWASSHAGVAPDLMCIGKAFASLIPMGATLATERDFDAFRGGKERALMYGHTFCGNPLGAALAREVLAVYRDEDVLGQVARKAPRIASAFARLGAIPGVTGARGVGMIGAADSTARADTSEAQAGACTGRRGSVARTCGRSEIRSTCARR